MEKCKKIIVWFCEDWKSWGVSWYDSEENLVGESDWYHTKSEAVDMARAYKDSGRCEFIEINKKAA